MQVKIIPFLMMLLCFGLLPAKAETTSSAVYAIIINPQTTEKGMDDLLQLDQVNQELVLQKLLVKNPEVAPAVKCRL